MKKTIAIINLCLITLTSQLMAQGNSSHLTAAQAAELYMKAFVNQNDTALRQLNEYVKPEFPNETKDIYLHETLEEQANNSADYKVSGYPEAYEKQIKTPIYNFFYEQVKLMRSASWKITKVVVTNSIYGDSLKDATVHFEFTAKRADFSNISQLDYEKSSAKQVADHYNMVAARLKNAAGTITGKGQFVLSGHILNDANSHSFILWYLSTATEIYEAFGNVFYPERK